MRRTALTVFLVVLCASGVAFFVGLLAQIWPLFVAGAAAFVGCAMIADVVDALRVGEPGDDPARRRSRRRLAIAEVALTFGWVGIAVAAWYDQEIVLGFAWGAGIVVIAGLFRVLRRERGLEEVAPETLADAPASTFTQEQTERFWGDRNARRIWAALLLFEICGYGLALMGGVLLAGETLAGALGVTLLLLVPVTLVAVGLHKWLDIPFSEMPPRPEPAPEEVPQQVEYRVGVLAAALLPFALSFVALVFGAIVIAEGRKGPDPAIGSLGTVVVAAAMAASVACAIAILVRTRRMRLQVGPHGIRVVNFWSSRTARWNEIERVYAARSAGLTAVTAVGSGVGGVDLPDARGLRVQLKDPWVPPIRVGVRNFTGVHGDARFQRVLVALRREAAAHGVPADL